MAIKSALLTRYTTISPLNYTENLRQSTKIYNRNRNSTSPTTQISSKLPGHKQNSMPTVFTECTLLGLI